MNYKTEEILIICLALAIMIATVIITDPNIFGYVTYSPSFTYNESLVDTTNGYSLISTTETIEIENSTQYESYITLAIKDGDDKTSKLQTLDENTANVNKNKILDVTFDHELNNNDQIKLYITEGDATDIYLCAQSTQCDSPGYGLVNYEEDGVGYYTIIISNLENPTNIFNIDPIKIKIDFIYAIYTEYNNHNITNTIYPESAILISDFIEPINLSSWGLLEKAETLNDQSILYEYTTDTEWNTIEDFNLSNINSAKIKFKVTLQSDTTNTPILHNLTLNYYLTEQENPTETNCTESWNCTDWLECTNLTQTRTCIDLNDCGTELEKPIETQECEEIQAPPSGGSSGGGGNAAPSTSYNPSSSGGESSSTQEVSETKKETKTISLYDFSEPQQTPPITGSIVTEKKPTKYFVNIILFSVFVLVCYLFYKKLIKKK